MTVKENSTYADEWKNLPWKQFQKNLFRLQHRIYKAAKEKDYNSVKRLQSLLLGSKGSKYLAVREVTQHRPKNRFQLVNELNSMKEWKHRKGKQISQGIPNIRIFSAMQCLVKYALEPVYESYASDGSYEFRPKDVQNFLFQNLKSNCNGYKKNICRPRL